MTAALTMTDAPPLLPWQALTAAAIILGVLIGLALYYLVDRVQVTGHTYRDLRHAAWRTRRGEICGVLLAGGDICGELMPCPHRKRRRL